MNTTTLWPALDSAGFTLLRMLVSVLWQSSFGDIELKFSEKVSSLIAKNPVQVDLLVWEPKDFLKLYFMFNRESKEDKGFYKMPMIFTFADTPSTD